MDANRRFAELVGVEWHEISYANQYNLKRICTCGGSVTYDPEGEIQGHINPDYAADPHIVLREIERMNRLSEFLLWLSKGESVNRIHVHFMTDTTGQLRDRAVEWLETKSDRC